MTTTDTNLVLDVIETAFAALGETPYTGGRTNRNAKAYQARGFCSWWFSNPYRKCDRKTEAALRLGHTVSAMQRAASEYRARVDLGPKYCRVWYANHCRMMEALTSKGFTK